MLAGRDPGPIQSPSNGTQGKPLSAKTGAPTLTNADVIGLLKGGVPESAIIHQINSSNKKFDFSSASCQALTQAKVSPKILDAMGDGSVKPCYTGGVRSGGGNGADDLNPQPFPPKSTTARRAAVVLSAPKQSQKITNPKASSLDAAIIAVLQKQRQAADAEATQMKLGIRPAIPSTGPSRTMSAGEQYKYAAGVNSRATCSGSCRLPGSNPTSATNRYGALPQGLIPGLALQCGHDPRLRILSVSGGSGAATFTQDDKYNFYTVTGCSFGDVGPNSKAYIYYQGTFHEDFQIEEWSDNWIKIHLDPKCGS